MPFEIDNVHELLDVLRLAGIDVVVTGGWGVDALLGEQSRSHDDIDIWVAVEQDESLRDALASQGFAESDGGVPQNYVLANEHGRKVDVHLVRWRSDGAAVYEMASGGEYVMPAEAFTTGSIGGRVVRCVSAEQQMLDHADGYEPDNDDHDDMRLLHQRLGVDYVPPFGGE